MTTATAATTAAAGPGDQQHHVALVWVKRGECRGDRAAGGAGGQPGLRPFGERLGDGVDAGAFQRQQQASLVAAMPADEVSGDPEQPGPGVGPTGVVTITLTERRQEGLSHDVLGRAGAEAAGSVPGDSGGVAPEHLGEQLGLVARPPDDIAVG
jgi:hypothetical protein